MNKLATSLHTVSFPGRPQGLPDDIAMPRRKAGNAKPATRANRRRRDPVSKAVLKPATLGQVFTPDWLVKDMLDLRKNTGRVLEPSCGSGAFSNVLHQQGGDLVALELDGDHAPPYATNGDFFDYPVAEQFDAIIGNPPYLRHQDIPAATKAKLDMGLFDSRTNLYFFFIEKCVRHLADGGELIFVVPRDFPRATAARKLNRWLFEQGSITDFWETGDQSVFKGASPPCCVFRFEKGRKDRTMHDGRVCAERMGQLLFLPASHGNGVPLSNFFKVSVGGLSGADSLFVDPQGSLEIVCSETVSTGKTRRMLHGDDARKKLAAHKGTLLARTVRKFKETNWWEWGRAWKKSDLPRVYVNAMTRKMTPFFTHSCTAYDGSVLALFVVAPDLDVAKAAAVLNRVDWEALGFKAGGKFVFSQRALENCLLPQWAAAGLAACRTGHTVPAKGAGDGE